MTAPAATHQTISYLSRRFAEAGIEPGRRGQNFLIDLNLQRLIIERSQSGGRHAIYRCETPVPGNRKLAQRTLVVPSAEPAEVTKFRSMSRGAARGVASL